LYKSAIIDLTNRITYDIILLDDKLKGGYVMSNSLFQKLNEPFRYEDYSYNSNDKMVYVGGQVVAERLNEVLGVGFWKYEPLLDSIKTVDTGKKDRNNNNIISMNLLVKLSIWNKDINEWVSFIDSGSQKMNPKMQESDATKAAITDGMKKCASRLGVASDLYAGRISADESGTITLPYEYKAYYAEKGWTNKGKFGPAPKLSEEIVGRLKRVKEGLQIQNNEDLDDYVKEATGLESATWKDIDNKTAPKVLELLETKQKSKKAVPKE
jgi:hypothetical protein